MVGREAMELAGLGLELDHPVRSCMNAMVRRVIRLGCVLLVRMLCFTSTVFFFTMSRSSLPSTYCICNQPITHDCNVSLTLMCWLQFMLDVEYHAEFSLHQLSSGNAVCKISTISTFVLIVKPPVFIISGRIFVPSVVPIDGSVQVRLKGGLQLLRNRKSRMIYSRLTTHI